MVVFGFLLLPTSPPNLLFFVSFNKNTFLLVHVPEKALLYRITVFTIKTSRCRIFISRNPVFSQAFLQLRITLMQQLLSEGI